jgi:hypothetical protein
MTVNASQVSSVSERHVGHTPGPWEAQRSRIHVAGKGNLATVENPWNNEQEREANARLIADAPKLLAQAQSLTAEKAALVEQVRVRTELLAEMRSWPSIRAAIAGHTLEQRLNAALNDASGAINREG